MGSLRIKITDRKNASAVVGCGAKPRFLDIIPLVTSEQINGWIAAKSGKSGRTNILKEPFGVGEGDCRFFQGHLFFYAGVKNAAASNILMVLGSFPVIPATGSSGDGRLDSPPLHSPPVGAGFLTAGLIKWEIF
jgi:hypothetical protein